MTLATVKSMDPRTFGLDILIGSLAVGSALGIFVAAATYITLRGFSDDAFLAELMRQTSDRYLHTSLTAWEVARARLRTDSVYRMAACAGLLCSGRVLVDIGCRQGLMLAFLIDSRRAFRAGTWPAGAAAPPEFERMVGVEVRPRFVHLARQALGSEAEIVQADATAFSPEPCHTVLMLDVLHTMSAEQQERLLAAMVSALDPGGVVLVREANADAGWRVGMMRAINRLGALALGRWRRRLHFRTMAQWLVCFDRLGFEAEVVPTENRTPLGSVLFRLTVRRGASAVTRQSERSG
jgi:SAM-dependent methyltransferase